ncbi:1-acyl-sn-glycerol-3-phosphate acyltransferase [uncultured Candidatus Thioglobus sp.]|nr:1-acyl-sn-glycerol-3-phosphate acyltransferase [uncultured Candidatus Thioglobus sp.]
MGALTILIVLVTIALVLFFIPFKVHYAILSKWSVFCLWWLDITCNIQTKVIGAENIPKQACVIISNHQSTWETLGFQQIFAQQTWVLKKQLLWIPIFGWGLALLKPIVIDRGEKIQALKKIIRQGADRINKGIFVIIFPEGTRQPYGKLGDYQKGGVAIAKKAKSDILPVFHNAGKIWAKGSFIKHAGVVTVIIGKPIKVMGKSATELTQEVRDWTEKQAAKHVL